MRENEFLWSRDPMKSVMGTATRELRGAIADESGEIVRGAISRFPIEQLEATAGNMLRQFVDVGVTEFVSGAN